MTQTPTRPIPASALASVVFGAAAGSLVIDEHLDVVALARALPRHRRDEAVCRLRSEGHTLDAIGAVFGVTRERVRQIVKAEGGPGRSEVAAARAARADFQRDLTRDRILAHLKLNAGCTAPQVAEALGLTMAQVRDALGTSGRRLLAPTPRVVVHGVPDEVLLDELRRAAMLVRGPLTVTSYNRVRAEIGGHSAILIMKRFDSWLHACRVAGVQPGRANREYARRWTPQEMLVWVARWLRQPGCRGTFADYEAWARTQPGAPGGQIVRDRVGRWSHVKAQALRVALTHGTSATVAS